MSCLRLSFHHPPKLPITMPEIISATTGSTRSSPLMLNSQPARQSRIHPVRCKYQSSAIA
jgi:hypothetical protein